MAECYSIIGIWLFSIIFCFPVCLKKFCDKNHDRCHCHIGLVSILSRQSYIKIPWLMSFHLPAHSLMWTQQPGDFSVCHIFCFAPCIGASFHSAWMPKHKNTWGILSVLDRLLPFGPRLLLFITTPAPLFILSHIKHLLRAFMWPFPLPGMFINQTKHLTSSTAFWSPLMFVSFLCNLLWPPIWYCYHPCTHHLVLPCGRCSGNTGWMNEYGMTNFESEIRRKQLYTLSARRAHHSIIFHQQFTSWMSCSSVQTNLVW